MLASTSRYRLVTDRLVLISATVSILDADLAGPDALAHQLGVVVGEGWPPPDLAHIRDIFQQQLAAEPELEGWLLWYWLTRNGENTLPLLVGAGGFNGRPDADGRLRVGCSLLPAFQDDGYALEAYEALIRWAWLQEPQVTRVLIPGYRPS